MATWSLTRPATCTALPIAGGKFGGGTVFQLKASNGKYTYKVIHSFATSSSTAYYPYAGLVVDSKNGYLYGTTYYGGVVWNAGAVYQLREVSGVWIFSVIYNFLGDSLGQYSESDLAVDATGNIYGTNYQGGAFNLGDVFKLTPGSNNKWTQKIIYSFKGYAKRTAHTRILQVLPWIQQGISTARLIKVGQVQPTI